MPEGSAPRAVSLGAGPSLIVSDVPSLTYSPETLEPKLADLDWVSAAGAAHHQVVDALSDAGAVVLPFRLFTLFSSEARAVASFDGSRAAMTRAFDRVRGKQEWVLRIGKPEPSTRSDRSVHGGPAEPRSSAPSSGTGFLQAKADAKREAAERAIRVKEDAVSAFAALEKLAELSKTRPVEGSGNLLLDAAFLVAPTRVEAMRDALTRQAERLLRDGCAVSLTGPWPPYSFASMDVGDD